MRTMTLCLMLMVCSSLVVRAGTAQSAKAPSPSTHASQKTKPAVAKSSEEPAASAAAQPIRYGVITGDFSPFVNDKGSTGS